MSAIVAAPPLEREYDEGEGQRKREGSNVVRESEKEGVGLELTPQDRHYLNRIFVK